MNASVEDAEGDRTWREAQAWREDIKKVNHGLKPDIPGRRELSASHNTCYTEHMAERTMSDDHKAAIAAGRIEAAAVRDYLDALETNRPKRGRQVSPETLGRPQSRYRCSAWLRCHEAHQAAGADARPA